MFVFVAREGAGLGKALVALVARVEPFAVVAAGRHNDHAAGHDRCRCEAFDASVELGLFAAAPRGGVGCGCGRQVAAVVAARVP